MTTHDTPSAGRGKVPVWRTAIDSYGFVFGNLDRFLALGWLLLVITFAMYMASSFLFKIGAREAASVADWVTYVALSASSWAMYAVFSVRWHRFFLLDERESVFSEILVARNWRFLGYTVLLTFAPMVPMFVISFANFGDFPPVAGPQSIETIDWTLITINWTLIILFGLSILAMPILVIVLFRFFLVLPATAVDRTLAFGEAWRNMRGNAWRFIGCLFLVAIPSLIFIWGLFAVFGQSLFGGGMTGGAPELTIGVRVVMNAVMVIIGFFITAVGITVLSTFYRHIVGMDAPGGGAHVLAEGP